MSVNKRQRRTPEEARTLLLDTAEARLAELGLEGLNVAGVAKAAGMSHATLLHHFGSSAGMRKALVERMSERLIADALRAFDQEGNVDGVVRDLFRVFSAGGHAKLLAWRAVEDNAQVEPSPERREAFDALLRASAAQLKEEDLEEARRIATLVIAAAIGLGVGAEPLLELTGMTEAERDAFPDWLAGLIDQRFN